MTKLVVAKLLPYSFCKALVLMKNADTYKGKKLFLTHLPFREQTAAQRLSEEHPPKRVQHPEARPFPRSDTIRKFRKPKFPVSERRKAPGFQREFGMRWRTYEKIDSCSV